MKPLAAWLHCRHEPVALEQPVANARQAHAARDVLTIELSCADGPSGRGEAAPLPGYSKDTLAECQRALEAIAPQELAALTELGTAADILECVGQVLSGDVPAARFALETALLDRLGRKLDRPIAALLGRVLERPLLEPVPSCALLPGEAASAVPRARVLFAEGVRSFKLKIGPKLLSDAQDETLGALRRAFGDGVCLRLDANQSFERADLARQLERCARHQPEFVEEPIAAPRPADFAGSPCRVALDESLQHLGAEQLLALLNAPALTVLVLKPTALGGFSTCIRLATLARALGRDAVVSHTLEGPLGWAACAALALALGPSRHAAGLHPLPHQLAGARQLLNGGRLEAPALSGLGVSM